MLDDEDSFYMEEWQIELYYELADAFSKKGLDEKNIWSNGYNYKFEYNKLNVNFCTQGLDGCARFVGEIYDLSIKTEEQIEDMLNACITANKQISAWPIKRYTNDMKESFSKWIDFTRRYNYRDLCIYGDDSQILINKLMKAIEMPIEVYIQKEAEKIPQILSLSRKYFGNF